MNATRFARTRIGLALLLMVFGFAFAGMPAAWAEDFYTVEPPCRLFDGQRQSGSYNPSVHDVQVTGLCDIPMDATAVVLSIAVGNPPAAGHLTLFQAGSVSSPNTSHLNFLVGETIASNATVPLSANGKLAVLPFLAGGGSTRLVLDVTGYYRRAAPEVKSTTPANGAVGVAAGTNLVIDFNKPVNVTGNWFQIVCTSSGTRNVTDTAVVQGPQPFHFTINPATDFTAGESCTVTVFAAQVSDQDAADPPDNMVANYTFTFTIDPGISPTAVDDAATVAEDSSNNPIDVLANDTDPDGGPKLVTAVDTTGTNGSVTITGGGTGVSYTPNANYCNTPPGTTLDTFTYTITGGDTATVSVTVTCDDDLPTAVNDAAAVAEDSSNNPIDVLANDTDIDGGTKLVTAVDTTGTNGSVSITGGGTGVSYTPNPNYCNTPPGTTLDTFMYTITGGSTATVTVTVTCSDDPPTAVNDTATVAEGSSNNPIDVLANDTDIDGGTKLVTAVDTTGTNGSVTITGGGTGVSYTPNAGYCNTPPGTTLDTFTYTITGGSTATVTVTVTCVNDGPIVDLDADDDKGTGGNDFATTFTEGDAAKLIEDPTDATVTDPDNASLASLTVTITNLLDTGNETLAANTTGTSITAGYVPATGVLTLTGPDTLANFQTVLRTVTYLNTDEDPDTTPRVIQFVANDGSTNSNTATSTVTVAAVNDDPTAVNDTATVAEDSTNNPIDVLANDTDPDGGTKLVTAVDTTGTNGSVSITGGGTGVSYTPNPNYCNTPPGTTLDTFTYTITGGSTATVTVTVTCIDDPPTAVNDAATVVEDSSNNAIDVLANDTDTDGGPKLVTAVDTTGTNGSVSITGGGTGVSYTPNPNYCNTPPGTTLDTFTYTITGGSQATVTVTVTCVDDNPTAVNDTATVTEDSTNNPIDVLANDTDVDGGTKQVTAVNTTGTNGSVSITGGGTGVSYTPNPNYCNTPPGTTLDTFTYTITGGSFATVSVTVTCVDDNPTAVNDTATVMEDSTNNAIDVLANDTDIDGGPKSVLSVNTTGTNGSVSITGGGTGVSYTPNPNYCNNPPGTTPDTFTYTITGGSQATVSVTVTCVDDPPTAVNDAATVIEDSTNNAIDVLANDTDIDGGPKFVLSVNTTGTNGSVSITGGGTGVSYTPNANYCNNPPGTTPDTFTYTITGGSTATVSVTVTCVPDAPTCSPLAGAFDYSTPGNTQLHAAGATLSGVASIIDPKNALTAANATDVDGPPPITIVPFTGNMNGGDWVLNGDGSFTFVPDVGFTGAATLDFQVKDGGNTAGPCGTITVNVGPRVWYIHDVTGGNNPGGGVNKGRSTNAFDTIAEFNAATTNNGDIIFVFEGNTGSVPHVGSITLKDGQKLWGQGIALNVPGFGTPIVNATNKPRIRTTTASADVVSVPATAGNRNNVEIRGLDLEATGATSNAIDVTSSGANIVGITISDDNIRGATAEGIDLNAGATGAFSATVQNNTITSANNGIDTDVNAAGTTTVTASSNMITSTAGNAFDARTLAGATALRVAFDNGNVAAAGTGILIDGSAAGTTTITGFANNVIDGSTVGTGISITSATFDANTTTAGFQQVLGGNTVVGATGVGNGVGGSGIFMTNVAGDLAFADLSVFAEGVGGTGLRIHGTGAVNTGAGTGTRVTVNNAAPGRIVEATGGPAVDVNNATIDLQLSSLKSTTTSTGVSLVNVSDGGGTNAFFSAPSGSSITASSGAGPAFNVSGGNAKITYGGTITNNGTGRAVSIATWSGDDAVPGDDLLLSGAIDENGAGILVNGNGGSRSITFSGGMDIDTTTGEGFAATSNTNTDGLHITGTNTIDSTSATGLRVTSTTIGNSNLNFQRISSGNNTAAADPANGIVLNATGTLGRLIVTGSGSSGQGGNATGGLIQNTTSHGISLTDTTNPSFINMSIQNTAGSGINGTLVAGFTFDNGTINNSGTGGAADDSNISFNDSNSNANASGTVTVTDSVLTNSRFHGIDIQHYNGTIAHADIENNSFTSAASVATSLGSAIRLDAYGTAAIVGNVTRATINNNSITNFPTGAGIHAFGGNSGGSGPAGTFGVPGSATDKIAITNNLMNGGSLGVGNQPDRFFTGGVNGSGQGNFDISGNGTVANPITNIDGVVIELNQFGTGSMTATVNNNRIVANNAVGSAGINVGCDADGTAALDNAVVTATISGNNVSDTDGPGIFAIARGSDCSLTAKILSNTVAAPDTTTAARAGIRVDSGSATGDTTLCLEISGNITAGSTNTATSTTSPGINLRKQGTSTTVNIFGIEGLSPSPAGTPTVENLVNGANTSTSGTFGVNGTALLSATTGFTSCIAP